MIDIKWNSRSMTHEFILMKRDTWNIPKNFFQAGNEKVLKYSDVSFWNNSHCYSTLIFREIKPIRCELWQSTPYGRFSLCSEFWCYFLGFSFVRNLKFYLLTSPSRWKCASSEVMITARSSLRIFNMRWLNSRRWTGSYENLYYTSMILKGWNNKFFFLMTRSLVCRFSSAWERRLVVCPRLSSLDARTRSTISSVTTVGPRVERFFSTVLVLFPAGLFPARSFPR